MIESTKENIEKFLLDSTSIESLEQNLEIIEKALECRKSDIEKAESTSEDYFIKLVKDVKESKKDLSKEYVFFPLHFEPEMIDHLIIS